MERSFVALGSVSAFCAVAAGAIGAHTLRGRVSADMLVIFETGVRYHMYHALGSFIVAWAVLRN